MVLYPSGLRGRSAKPLFTGSNPVGTLKRKPEAERFRAFGLYGPKIPDLNPSDSQMLRQGCICNETARRHAYRSKLEGKSGRHLRATPCLAGSCSCMWVFENRKPTSLSLSGLLHKRCLSLATYHIRFISQVFQRKDNFQMTCLVRSNTFNKAFVFEGLESSVN